MLLAGSALRGRPGSSSAGPVLARVRLLVLAERGLGPHDDREPPGRRPSGPEGIRSPGSFDPQERSTPEPAAAAVAREGRGCSLRAAEARRGDRPRSTRLHEVPARPGQVCGGGQRCGRSDVPDGGAPGRRPDGPGPPLPLRREFHAAFVSGPRGRADGADEQRREPGGRDEPDRHRDDAERPERSEGAVGVLVPVAGHRVGSPPRGGPRDLSGADGVRRAGAGEPDLGAEPAAHLPRERRRLRRGARLG